MFGRDEAQARTTRCRGHGAPIRGEPDIAIVYARAERSEVIQAERA
jgi:hypothetical protein